MSIIWCIIYIYIYHNQCNVKSCKKFNETAQTANFTDFPLLWKRSKMDQNYENANAFFYVANKFWEEEEGLNFKIKMIKFHFWQTRPPTPVVFSSK